LAFQPDYSQDFRFRFYSQIAMTSNVLLYDREAGEADVVGFDASGNMNLDWTNKGWRTSWDKIVVGYFVPRDPNPRDHRAPRHQSLLYDRNAGEADVVGFDSTGEMDLDRTNSGWRTSWDEIVVGHFVGNGLHQLLLYDRSAGEADVVGFDSTGTTNLDTTNTGWRPSWDAIAAGYFWEDDRQQVLLFDRDGDYADLVGFDNSGNFNMKTSLDPLGTNRDGMVVGDFLGIGRDQALRYTRPVTQTNADVRGWQADHSGLDVVVGSWRTSWDLIVTGNFFGSGLQQILLYDRASGQANIYGKNSAGNMAALNSFDGWRTTWDAIVVGDFVGNGCQQLLLYDRNAGEADVVGFDVSGNVNLDTTNSDWRSSWNNLVAF
jgi:hypothetical protein